MLEYDMHNITLSFSTSLNIMFFVD